MAASRVKVNRGAAIKSLRANRQKIQKDADAENAKQRKNFEARSVQYAKDIKVWEAAVKAALRKAAAMKVVDGKYDTVYRGNGYGGVIKVRVPKRPEKPGEPLKAASQEAKLAQIDQAIRILEMATEEIVTVSYEDIGRWL